MLANAHVSTRFSVWQKYKSDEHKLMPAGLILHSPLASGLRVFKPDLSLTWCCDPFKNVERVGQIVTPTLIVHGTADEIVPVSHGAWVCGSAGRRRRRRRCRHSVRTDPLCCDLWYMSLPI